MKKILIPALLCLTFAAGCTCENTIRRRARVRASASAGKWMFS